MNSSPGLATVAAAPVGTAAEQEVVAEVDRVLEAVFDTVAGIRADTAAVLERAAAQRRRPVTADLAALRPGLHLRLRTCALASGAGFIAAPGLLADVPAWLEWWQTTAEGGVRPLLPDLDPRRSAYSDYTHWDWFALPRDTGHRAVTGPYVDYLCSDEYGLTLSAPVEAGGRFAGVAAADVYLRHFEAAVLPLLRRLPGPAHLVNARGRVAASTDPARLTGSLTRGPDFAAVLARKDVAVSAELRLVPCRAVPLVLVVSRP
jgi:hypothetical protein